MLLATLFVWSVALALIVYAERRQPAAHRPALRATSDFLKPMMFRLPLAIIAAGFLGALLPQALVAGLLGDGSGLRGLLLASLLGGLLPGGPMVTFPLIVTVWQAGAGTAAMVAMLTAWSVYAFHRILAFEWPMMGWRFVVFRLIVSVGLPLLAGLFATAWLQLSA
jgi:uncharacterized membrane protein YraQ (UPF0718 family)